MTKTRKNSLKDEFIDITPKRVRNKDICYVEFQESERIVQKESQLPSLSDMIANCKSSGQNPYASNRPVYPIPDSDFDGPDFGSNTDKIDQEIQGRNYAAYVEDIEKQHQSALDAYTQAKAGAGESSAATPSAPPAGGAPGVQA